MQFKKPFIVALVTVVLDFLFHFFLTKPMETLTYFVIKFLLAFFVATFMFSLNIYARNRIKKKYIIPITGLIFSALMSTYYRAWEFWEAYAPFGTRAPDIIGIPRDNIILFSGTWWIGHALFFVLGVVVANKVVEK